ncbi:hypothetical protein N7492_005913 [Penicillium capsulatum]|uniref:ABM domain-containing protein n=1 Tax=Penicillium capsulatum TaxID=69766 RepID=A0A9W9LSD9_9EURO|nr:hypothetical protein N7492_005913 [Penicillium capsulatum]KAJ6134984.1 hypothetical protein N7512_000144 [Penicillium capsulatum]
MPITELALLRSKVPEPTPSTREGLRAAQTAQSDWSKFPVHFLRQEEDTSYFYLLGGWESVAEHTGEWITSKTNQEVLGRLKDDVDVGWMFHLDIDPSKSAAVLNAPVVSISRYFVEADKKAQFERVYTNGVPDPEAHISPLLFAGGWRIDKAGEDEEFVLLAGWNTVADHYKFPESDAFREFGKIKDAIKGVEIKHGRLEKWE